MIHFISPFEKEFLRGFFVYSYTNYFSHIFFFFSHASCDFIFHVIHLYCHFLKQNSFIPPPHTHTIHLCSRLNLFYVLLHHISNVISYYWHYHRWKSRERISKEWILCETRPARDCFRTHRAFTAQKRCTPCRTVHVKDVTELKRKTFFFFVLFYFCYFLTAFSQISAPAFTRRATCCASKVS